jgi:ATP-dependent helicase/DNAse subunit B
MTALPRVSASKLKLWHECATRYYYYYQTEIKEAPNIYGVSGSACHRAIELYYQEQKDPIQTYQEILAHHTFENMDFLNQYHTIVRDAHDMLRTFPFDAYQPVAHELYFSLPYPQENPFCTVNGFIDMVLDDGIVDFKTSKDTITAASVEHDLQFLLYAYVFERLYGKVPERVIYHRLRTHEQITARVFDFQRLATAIHQYVQGMQEQRENPPVLQPCDHCPLYCSVRKRIKEQKNHAVCEIPA